MKSAKPSYLDRSALHALHPTHELPGPFWEELGRTVGSFGFLEEVLGKAIFAFTATKNYSEDEIEDAYKAWLRELESALSDPLCRLAKSYGTAVKGFKDSTSIDELVQAIKDAAKLRNILCHASWRVPDQEGKSLPFFVSLKKQVCETKFDIASLRRIHDHVRELACDVIDSVTLTGYAFPGMDGPGERIWSGACLNGLNFRPNPPAKTFQTNAVTSVINEHELQSKPE